MINLSLIEKISIKEFTYDFPVKWQMWVIESKYLCLWDIAWIEATISFEDKIPEFTTMMAEGVLHEWYSKVINSKAILIIVEKFIISHSC